MNRYSLLVLLLGIFNTSNSYSQNIKIAVAASTQFAIKELINEFQQQTGIEVDIIVGSSGKLVAQIISGAPYHIYISANLAYADHVYKEGYSTTKPIVYARGSGVIWTTKDDIDVSTGLGCVLMTDIKTIAIASPKIAPYGVLAVDALKASDYYKRIEDKLIFGNSISQVNQYTTLGTVDIGITAKSIVCSPRMKGVGKWIDIEGYYIDQGMVMLTYSKNHNQKNTQKFYNFLQSNTSHKIFEKHGYTVN